MPPLPACAGGTHPSPCATTGKMETLPDAQIGFFNTPVFANLSVGYVFQ